ncbi:aminopeptidase N, putative [Eimeria maxima]|uniref:Aminopeptidase N, putative n=1 Tax=Eimeria maxima TaxID=5804 RepID=U6MD33_EIMMA|nr:aminopeptidase N, putative [Eimeria maxima]CDJ61946.1 aminopeptidase N, putative [Eimeria maxima]
MWLTAPHLGFLVAPVLLHEVTRGTGISCVGLDIKAGNGSNYYLDAAAPSLLTSLLTPSSPHSWRRWQGMSAPYANVAGASSGAFSLLPHIQMAAAASSPAEVQREEGEELGNASLRPTNASEQHADAGARSPHGHRRGNGPQQPNARTRANAHAHPKQEDAHLTATADPPDAGGNTYGSELTAIRAKQRGRPGEKFRDEYKPSDFAVDSVDLDFFLEETNTKVIATIIMQRTIGTSPTDLVLNGEELDLVSLTLNGKKISDSGNPNAMADGEEGYRLGSDGSLIISKAVLPKEAGESFTLQTQVDIHPKANLKLRGLYASGSALVTQCEAEGFRRITYFLDRPDVLAKYTVRLEANKEKYPVLLSNGNKTEEGPVQDSPDRHFVVFTDPHPKPSYLFAILAGDFAAIVDTFTTKSGKEVALAVYSEPEQMHKLNWAMHSVKVSMKWEEDHFGREYDLDTFNVACVSDFNAGAMENKGLNIFNCSLLLASMQTSTDDDFERVLAVVGHEYFHNWTGNRVTVRDWFQLTLKEGLTVFREQLFMGTFMSAGVQRIKEVADLISRQFPEDDGPMAHPIRPESYLAMDNFYTATVYDKGAEVVRIYYTLLGASGFRKGMDLYFKRHDNKPATCDDFRAAMADANGINLDQMDRWYSQAGTPRLEVLRSEYKEDEKAFEISFRQHTPPTRGQETKRPQLIPIKIGLIGRASHQDLLQPAVVLEMTEEEQTFRVRGVREDCVPSILRGFSAPVRLINRPQTAKESAFLLAYDTDPVTKWFASRALATPIVISRSKRISAKGNAQKLEQLPDDYVEGLRTILTDQATDNALKALILQLPDWNGLSTEMRPVNPEALHKAIRTVKADLATALKPEMSELYKQLTLPTDQEDEVTEEATGRRKLRNTLLHFLSAMGDEEAVERAYKHFTEAKCMTDKYAGLIALSNIPVMQREKAFSRFYDDAAGDSLVVDKWFKAQALSDLPDQVERIAALLHHPAFSLKNPNRLRSLVYAFAAVNHVHFHRSDGKGYELLAGVILQADRINPVAASRGAKIFLPWRQYDEQRQQLIQQQLQRILAEPSLSRNVREVVVLALDSPPPPQPTLPQALESEA